MAGGAVPQDVSGCVDRLELLTVDSTIAAAKESRSPVAKRQGEWLQIACPNAESRFTQRTIAKISPPVSAVFSSYYTAMPPPTWRSNHTDHR